MEDKAHRDPLLAGIDDTGPAASHANPPVADSETSPPPDAIRTGELAVNLRDNSAAGWLYWVTNSTLGEQIGPDAFLVFRKLMLEEAGSPADPIERMLIEQLALAHFSIGQLRIRSCATDVPKMSLAFSDSATRLLGEFRRCSLALEDYRSKRAARTEKRESTGGNSSASTNGNGHLPALANGNGKGHATKVSDNLNGKHESTTLVPRIHGDMPEWIKKRMACPTPNGSPLAVGTASNGRG